jgi:Tfp pilus assembly protein PilN
MVDSKTMEDKTPAKGEVQIDEFDNDYVANFQLQPSERMLASFDLQRGVIALNVYEDNILKDNFGATSKKDIDTFIKSKMTPKQVKAGDWQTSVVTIGEQKQNWLHKGTNRLLDMLRDYQKTNHMQLFFQLADANDVALTDYFRVAYEQVLDKDTLLVYLGQEYRKAFLFRDGHWADTLKLQITQTIPEPEVISSKLALAIDSAQLKEPELIVVCGDMANSDLVDYIKSQFPSAHVELLGYQNLVISTQDTESFDASILSQFTIPIALAYKALFPEDDRFTPSNFLPSRIIEGQKVFKIAWHGFIVLFLIFAWALIFTNLIMKETLLINQENLLKRDLDFRLEARRKEAIEIQKIRTELDAQEKNIQVLKDLLVNKNPWTETLNIANRVFSGQALSWLNNMKLEGEFLRLSGVTTKRAAIIEFANAFPGSQIRKVSNTKIRNTSVWAFELNSPLPKVDWVGEIQRDVESLLRLKQNVADTNQPGELGAQTDAGSLSATDIVGNIKGKFEKNTVTGPVKPIAPQNPAKSPTTDKKGRAILPWLPQSSCPTPRDEHLTGKGQDILDYYTFIASANRGNIWEYRDMGTRFLNRNPNSELLPAVRWWMSYRLYLDKEYHIAVQYLEPMLKASDRYYPYALLLQARVFYALGNTRYREFYNLLKNDYGRHSLMSQVNEDLAIIGKGDGK